MGSDLSVVRAARVSYDAAWRAGENEGSDARLINYLWEHKHSTPFEAVTFSFEVHAPIFVFRQWHRHRTQSYNELSARYRELPEQFYIPAREHLLQQATNNKQGRAGEPFNKDDYADMVNIMTETNEDAFAVYRSLLERGVARELARSVLPVSTYSTMFTTMNLLNLLKFLTLRADPHAQYEIRIYAEAMIELVRPICPVSIGAWEKSDVR